MIYAVLLLFIITPLFGQDVNLESLSFSNFNESELITKYPADVISPQHTPLSENVWTVDGILTKQTGDKKANTVTLGSDTVRNLYEFRQVDGTRYFMGVVGSSVVYSQDAVTFSVLIGTLNANYTPDFETWQDKLYFSNGYDNVQEWTGTAIRSATECPKGRYLVQDGNRMWVMGVTGNRSALYYSALNNIDNFPTLNIDYVGADDGDFITGARMFKGNMQIFKQYSVWQKIGSNPKTFRLRKMTDEAGCLFNSSIDEVNNKLYWWSHRGVVESDGYNINIKSMPWDDVVQDMAQTTPFNAYWLQSIAGDFATGVNLNVDTDTVSGSILVGSTTLLDTTSSDFNAGTLSSTTVESNSVRMGTGAAHGYARVEIGATDGGGGGDLDYSNPMDYGQSFSVLHEMDMAGSATLLKAALYISSHTSAGALTIGIYNDDGSNNPDLSSVIVSSSLNSNDVGALGWYNVDLSTDLSINTTYWLGISMNAQNRINWEVTYSTPYAVGKYNHIVGGWTECQAAFMHQIYIDGFISTQTYASEISTITSGQDTFYMSATTLNNTLISNSSVTYYVRTASTVADVPTATRFEISNGGNNYPTLVRKFMRWEADLVNGDDTSWDSPTVDDVTLTLRYSSGAHISQEKNCAGWKTWGIFESNDSAEHDTGINYLALCSTYSGGTLTSVPILLQPGYDINSTTGPYIRILSSFTVNNGTANARVDDYTVNWYRSASKQPVAGVRYGNRYLISITTSGNINHLLYILQENGKWTTATGRNAYCFGNFGGETYYGDGTANGYIYQCFSSATYAMDDGSAVDAKYDTAIINCGYPHQKKIFDKYYVTAENTPCTLYTGYRLDGSTGAYDSCAHDLRQANRIVIDKRNFPAGKQGDFIQYRFWNKTANENFKVRRLDMYFSTLPPD